MVSCCLLPCGSLAGHASVFKQVLIFVSCQPLWDFVSQSDVLVLSPFNLCSCLLGQDVPFPAPQMMELFSWSSSVLRGEGSGELGLSLNTGQRFPNNSDFELVGQ